MTPPNLAGVPAGEEVRVEEIVLDLVRARCFDLGIAVGHRLRIRHRSEGEVVVRTAGGRTVRLSPP